MIERLGYLISSHMSYNAPRFRLLESMRGIDPNCIVVVEGGHPEEDRRMWHHPIVCVAHNSYDYNGIIDLVEFPNQYPAWSHVFLLHDTMELGPDSDRLIRSADPALDCVAVWGGQCNLALYRVDYLLRKRGQILALKNCSKRQAIDAEGFLCRTGDARLGSYTGDCQIVGEGQPYDGATRLREYYSGVDLTKWKANWGQDGPVVVTP